MSINQSQTFGDNSPVAVSSGNNSPVQIKQSGLKVEKNRISNTDKVKILGIIAGIIGAIIKIISDLLTKES